MDKDKVQILTTCRACQGQAYLPTNEVMQASDGHYYIRHVRCTACQGSGMQTHWIPIREFAQMLLDVITELQRT